MKRRTRTANGEHSIYKMKNGPKAGTFIAQVVLEVSPEGRVLKKKTFHGKRRAEVKKRMDDFLREMEQGIRFSDKANYGKWIVDWLELYKKPPLIRQSTFDNYRMWIDNHIIPALGHMEITEITTDHIQKLYNDMTTEKNLSAESIQRVHSLISQSYNKAVELKMCPSNPAKATVRPTIKRKAATNVLTREEMDSFIKEVNEEDIRWKAAFLTLLGSGIRIGELLALEWQDVDFENKELDINKTLSRTKGGLVIEEPKTESGKRKAPLPSIVLEAIGQLKKSQEFLVKHGEAVKSDIVFTTINGTHIIPRNFQRKFYTVRNRAGVPKEVSVHGLRHTLATRLLEEGEDMRVIMEILGHSDITITANTYSHVLPETKRRAVSRMDSFLS